jgi:hypothetical protein
VFVREATAQQDLLAQALVLLLVYDKPSAAHALARQADAAGTGAGNAPLAHLFGQAQA